MAQLLNHYFRLYLKTYIKLRTIISLEPVCICHNCGEEFKYKKHRGVLLKTLLFFADIRKYYCANCKITYYVYIGTEAKVTNLFRADKH